MYWSQPQVTGERPPALRAHTTTLVGNRLVVFGGCADECYDDVYVLDLETLTWTKPETSGAAPGPHRAHTSTLIGGRYLYMFGGGNGPNYFNDLHVLDCETFEWFEPETDGEIPSERRAHTSVPYQDNVYVFGGGDGVRALNELYVLETAAPTETQTWHKMETTGDIPASRGYHSGTLVGDYFALFGGSDGIDCFADVHFLNLESMVWAKAKSGSNICRLAHSVTLVGDVLCVIGGHDGSRYVNECVTFNLETMEWEAIHIGGRPPSDRGYHSATLYDHRIYVLGGFDGHDVFDDLYLLDLATHAHLTVLKDDLNVNALIAREVDGEADGGGISSTT